MAQRQPIELPHSESARTVSAVSGIWYDYKRDREVPVRIYAPEGEAKRLPVVVFSHGIGENRDSYEFLGRALAAEGFLAVHVTHAGTDRAVLERGYRHLYRAVRQKENWVNRPLDVSFVLDTLGGDSRADLDRVAVAGHSAGAFTAFALAGVRLRDGGTFHDARVQAIVPMSMPRLDEAVPPGGYDDVDIPVLNITGTCDASLIYRTLPRHRRRPFDETRASSHYLVTIDRANHNTFSATSDRHHRLLARLTVTFLRGFLLGDAAAAAWFRDSGLEVVDGTRLTIESK